MQSCPDSGQDGSVRVGAGLHPARPETVPLLHPPQVTRRGAKPLQTALRRTREAHRDRLLDLAYGMLGRVSSAKDIVQDAYLRWQDVDPETVDDPGAYLSTIVTRLCLDELTSARAERETYTVMNPEKLQHLSPEELA